MSRGVQLTKAKLFGDQHVFLGGLDPTQDKSLGSFDVTYKRMIGLRFSVREELFPSLGITIM